MTSNSLQQASGNGSLSERLRADTRPEHEAIETALAIPGSIRSSADYTRLLAGFYGFYQPLEQRLFECDWQGSGIDPDARRKAPLLAADLRACGMEPETIPQCPQLPPCQSLAEGFGCLYVLEGATLGGAIIHRELVRHLGDWIRGKDHFHQCYGENRGAMWRTFKEALNRFGEQCERGSQDRVIVAARATFRGLQSWLEGDANA